MYSTPLDIINWISSTSEAPSPQPTTTLSSKRKRKACRYPSPTPSMTDSQQATPKRRHIQAPTHAISDLLHASDEDIDETPTQNNKRPPSTAPSSEAQSQESSVYTSESQGSAATPSKRRRRTVGLAVATTGAPKTIDGTEPGALRDMARHFESVEAQRHFLWPELKERVLAHDGLKDTVFYGLTRAVWYYDDQPAPEIVATRPLGPSPSVAGIHDILTSARECDVNLDPESQWNCAVHYPLLKLALQGSEEQLRVSSCTSATISSQYMPDTRARGLAGKDTKKIDFCITLCNKPSHPGIARVNQDWNESINHTSHSAYTATPIAISIETKARAPDEDEAILQLQVWLSAHFARLQQLVGRQSDDPVKTRQRWAAAVDELCFLPAIMVLKHEWFFVAATWAPDRPILWKQVALGSTRNPEGICQIIYCVRKLAEWAHEVYWPWFQKWALGGT